MLFELIVQFFDRSFNLGKGNLLIIMSGNIQFRPAEKERLYGIKLAGF